MQNTLWILWFKETINYKKKYLIYDKTISTDTYVFMLSNFPQQAQWTHWNLLTWHATTKCQKQEK